MNDTIRRVCKFDWKKKGIKKGDVCVVRFGSVRVGQLISVIYRDTLYIQELVGRTPTGLKTRSLNGTITVLDSNYKVEGAVIEIRPQTAQERKEEKAKAIKKEREREALLQSAMLAIKVVGFDVVKESFELVKLGFKPDEVIRRVTGHHFTKKKPATVTDINLWRQSHPRPIKTCAVAVE